MNVTEEMLIAYQHGTNLRVLGDLLNKTSKFLNAPDGSGEEEVTEDALMQAMLRASKGDAEIGSLLMAFATMCVSVCDEDKVQSWFDSRAEDIKAILGMDG